MGARKARQRLEDVSNANIIVGDFLEPLLPHICTEPFDAVIVTANTLFTTPHHGRLLQQCASVLEPGGILLLDVYNALLYHHEEGEGEWVPLYDNDGAGGSDEDDGADDAYTKTEDSMMLLVCVTDEDGREWEVYEDDPVVDEEAQSIACRYDFVSPADELSFSETLVHHYLLPEQLVRLLDAHGFDIEDIFGDFCGAKFVPEESEHVVVAAKRR